jgi:RHS repeat-associated protein
LCAHHVSFVLDALGRHASQTIGTGGGSVTTAYAYLGTSNTVSSMSVGTSVTTTSLIDAIGNRLGEGTASGFGGYLLADLHGNIAAAVSAGSSPALLSAYRYDAYGETCGSWTADSGSINVPWRFGGRLLESISGTTTDLYDFGARSYDPSLGAFTSFDSVSGSAGNPLTLNRYLYANANPATLVDPDGHCSWNPLDGDSCESQPFKLAWETGQNTAGYTAGMWYQAPGIFARFATDMVEGTQCMADTSCGVNGLQQAYDAFSKDPLGSARSAASQVAFAGADIAKGFEDCKVSNDYFSCGQHASEILFGTELNGLTLIYGGKGIASAIKDPIAALKTAASGAKSAGSLVRSLPSALKTFATALGKTADYVKANGWGSLPDDWIRFDDTIVSNQILQGPGVAGSQKRPAIELGGKNPKTGYELPFHGHIGIYNLLQPSLWFKQTEIIRPPKVGGQERMRI